MNAHRTSLMSKTCKTMMGVLVLGAFVTPATAVWAQGTDMHILLDRMERLERDIRTLNRQVARGAATAAPVAQTPSGVTPVETTPAQNIQFNEGEGALARVTVRLSALEEEVRHATGLAEGMTYRIDQISARLDKLITDLDYRLARLEGGSGGYAGGSLAAQPSISAVPPSPSISKIGEMAPPTSTMPPAVTSGERGTVGAQGTYIPPKSGGGTLGSISKTKLDQFMPQDDEQGSAPDAAPDAAAQQAAAVISPAQPQALGQPQAAPQAVAPQTPAVQTPAEQTPAPEPAVVTVLPEGTPRERYQFAFGLMSQARYADAETALKEFIEKHSDDPLVGNAWYWLGETHYVRKSFMDAAQTFFQAYKIAPEGAKAPDSLLKLGMSMASLEKVEEACTTYGKLRKEFIDLKPSIERTLNRETKRLKCK